LLLFGLDGQNNDQNVRPCPYYFEDAGFIHIR
jgi:hypothetical protein